MINDLIISQIRQRLEILYQMVDQLEEGGGGGGGGGTTNYNELSNKPSIEGQQLVGNKTASDLGLATTSQLNRKVDKEEGSSLMTAAQATKLEGIQAGAEVNVQADWNQTNSNADDYIKNKPTIPTPITVDQTYNATSANAQSGKAVAQAISTKVDKETGKGLSTNDFTTAEKNKLSGIEQGATRTVIDTDLSSTSTNPVQNKAVQAPVARLVDAGAKNFLKITATSQTINGVTFTVNADQTITVNGTNTGTGSITFVIVSNQQAILIPDGDYLLLGCPQGGSSATFDLRWYRYSPNASAYDMGSGAIVHKSGNTTDSNIAIVVKSGATVNNITFKPMLCTVEDYAISPEFVPYTPTMRELYEMIRALQ